MNLPIRLGLVVIVLPAVVVLTMAILKQTSPKSAEQVPLRPDVATEESAPTESMRMADERPPLEAALAAGEAAPMQSMSTAGGTVPLEAALAAGEAAPMESLNASGEMTPMEAQLAAGEMAPMESMNAAGEPVAPLEALLAAGSQLPAECMNASGATVMEGMAEAMGQCPQPSAGAGINLMEEEREDFLREKMTEENDAASLGRAPKGGS